MSNSMPPFEFNPDSATPFPDWTPTPPPMSRMASSTPDPRQTTRIVYTESLKIALMKLCVFHCERYLNQTESEAKFWVHVRDEFAPLVNLPPPDRTKINAGNNIRIKVKEITEARQKELELQGIGTSGIGGRSTGNSELGQITDQWLEIVARKQTEKEQKTSQVKEETEKEQRRRQEARDRLTQALSQRRDVREVESALEDRSQLPVREKRRKIGAARARAKKRTFYEEDTELRESFLKLSEQAQETLQAVQRMLHQIPPSVPPSVQSSVPLSSVPSSIPSSAVPSSIPLSVPSSNPSSISMLSSVPTREEFDQLSAEVMKIKAMLKLAGFKLE